ncbi:MAG: cytochrome c1, partial [Candidatus Zixiibacteriota bacterium]
LNLSPREANALASWFLKDVQVPTNLTYRYYEGRWPQLPDFSRIKPKRAGGATGFDLRLAGRKNNYALRFEGFLQVRRKGRYTFFVGSDDGAKLYLDGRLVVNNDGEHPFSIKSRKVMLSPGPHPLVLEFAQVSGGAELRVEYQGPGIIRRSVAVDVTATKEPPKPEPAFQIDPALVEKGRRLFTTVGCASCHVLREKGQRLAPQLAARPLEQLAPRLLLSSPSSQTGCVGKKPLKGAPFFALSDSQRKALSTALQKRDDKKEPAGGNVTGGGEEAQAVIHRTMLQLNCYACHSRHKIGGPVDELDAAFVTTTREMGDEGRLPPPLDGVGDKLTDEWLKHVLSNGADDRPYMLTRMPKFGTANAGHLVTAFAQADRKTLAKIPQVDIKPLYMKAAGRHLVGEKAFACIKCHTFGPYQATGIQSLDLTQFHRRIRQDWFFRYMMKPIRYRPGTRMPTPFPGGISTLPDVLDGQPA